MKSLLAIIDTINHPLWTIIILLVLSREWMGMGEWDDYY